MENATWTAVNAVPIAIAPPVEDRLEELERRIAQCKSDYDFTNSRVDEQALTIDHLEARLKELEQAHLVLVNRFNAPPVSTLPTSDPEPATFCESCGRVGRYWHGLRKTLCRRCAEESTYAIAHPWRVRAKRAGEVALLVGAVVIPFSALAVILFKIL